MDARPDLAGFTAAYEAGKAQVVSASLVADLETPVSALLKLADGRPFSFLLESVTGGAVRGRYSILGIKPDLIWRCRGERAEINRRARFERDAFEPCAEPALQSLRSLVAESRIELPPDLPLMAAGLFGQMSYDMVRLVERLPDANPDRLGLPDAVFMRPTVVALFDHIEDRITVVTPVWPSPELSARQAYGQACERVADAVGEFNRGISHEPLRMTSPTPAPVSNVTREQYHAMVERAKEYIRAGDIFQVVPSQRFDFEFRLPAFALYRALRRLNPSPFLFFLDLGDYALVGSSPEILVRLRDGTVTVRPIAGTRRRGVDRAEDEALAADLMADPKELAEHLMLLDLGRNDVGRVATHRHGAGHREDEGRVLLPRHAHRLERRGRHPPRLRRAGRADGGLPGGNRQRGAEGPGDGDHRRAGARAPRLLRRRRRLHRRRRDHGHLHRAAHRADQGRAHVRAGRRRRGGRQRPRGRVPGKLQQGARPHPCRRGGRPLRQQRAVSVSRRAWAGNRGRRRR